ncbi:hypothetical protein FOZG_16725 [Fusarium oxysporum Fo47]|uniref:Uncharacterized protein n=1 Tax=Fusarium oxysporum Fo47 TaxID=660027 RepID=W9JKF2_FUSOX|nr:hypothetical protein FOZG_16725 [Fusarium oxysporum Fo47]
MSDGSLYHKCGSVFVFFCLRDGYGMIDLVLHNYLLTKASPNDFDFKTSAHFLICGITDTASFSTTT